MRRLTVIYLLLVGIGNASAQSFQPLKIGDTIPDIAFETFYEPDGYCPSLQSLRGKTVILDFWNVGCTSCIRSMPKMDSLQEMFKDSLQVIYITSNTRSEVSSLFSKIRMKKPGIPFITDDTTYYDSLFPHVGDPLHVWINRKGMISAITGGYNATPGHVSEMLKNDKINLSLRSELKDFDHSVSLLLEASGRLKEQARYYSIFLQGLSQVTGKIRLLLKTDSLTGEPYMVQAINASAYKLINFAWADKLFKSFSSSGIRASLVRNNRIVFETKDLFWRQPPANGNDMDLWKELYTYGYELYAPSQGEDHIFDLMRRDLQVYLPLKMYLEQRVMECLVLKRVGKSDKLRTRHAEDVPDQGTRSGFYARNIPLQSSLLPSLVISCQLLKTPVVDETGYYAPVDLELNCELSNLPVLQKELARYGLSLAREKKKVAVLVIRDK